MHFSRVPRPHEDHISPFLATVGDLELDGYLEKLVGGLRVQQSRHKEEGDEED